jgi:hypothetical protein
MPVKSYSLIRLKGEAALEGGQRTCLAREKAALASSNRNLDSAIVSFHSAPNI